MHHAARPRPRRDSPLIPHRTPGRSNPIRLAEKSAHGSGQRPARKLRAMNASSKRLRRTERLLPFAAALLFACGNANETAPDAVVSSPEGLTLARNRAASSIEYAHPDSIIPAGIAGGARYFFVGSPLDGRVMVFSRATAEQIGE